MVVMRMMRLMMRLALMMMMTMLVMMSLPMMMRMLVRMMMTSLQSTHLWELTAGCTTYWAAGRPSILTVILVAFKKCHTGPSIPTEIRVAHVEPATITHYTYVIVILDID